MLEGKYCLLIIAHPFPEIKTEFLGKLWKVEKLFRTFGFKSGSVSVSTFDAVAVDRDQDFHQNLDFQWQRVFIEFRFNFISSCCSSNKIYIVQNIVAHHFDPNEILYCLSIFSQWSLSGDIDDDGFVLTSEQCLTKILSQNHQNIKHRSRSQRIFIINL